MRKSVTRRLLLVIGLFHALNSLAEANFPDPTIAQKISLQVGNYFFHPQKITVKLNQPVELTIQKEPDDTTHSFVVDSEPAGIKFNETLNNDPLIIRFTPTQEGQFEFHCDQLGLLIPNHRAKGMKGVIEVVK